MVTMAKGIGNGAPLGAMHHAAGDRRDDEEPHPLQHFGGNPIAMTQGLATLEVIDEEDIQQNALDGRRRT